MLPIELALAGWQAEFTAITVLATGLGSGARRRVQDRIPHTTRSYSKELLSPAIMTRCVITLPRSGRLDSILPRQAET